MYAIRTPVSELKSLQMQKSWGKERESYEL